MRGHRRVHHRRRVFAAVSLACAALSGAGCKRGATGQAAPATATSRPSAAARALQVVTWNIHGGREGLELVIAELRRAAADVVLLQEAEVNSPISRGANQAEAIATALGMEWYSAGSALEDGGEQHMAILSRWPLREAAALDAERGRIFGVTAIVRSEPPVRVASVHLTATFKADGEHMRRTAERRESEARYLAKRAQAWAGEAGATTAIVIGGDFNMPPGAPMAAPLHEALHCVTSGGPTHPSDAPVFEIDYFFVSGAGAEATARRGEARAADHLPVFMTMPAVLRRPE